MISSDESDLLGVAKLIVLNRRLRFLGIVSLIFGITEVITALIFFVIPFFYRAENGYSYFWYGQPYIDLISYLFIGVSSLISSYRRSVSFIRWLMWSFVVFVLVRLLGLLWVVLLFKQDGNMTSSAVRSNLIELLIPIGVILLFQYPLALAFYRTAKEITEIHHELLKVEYDDDNNDDEGELMARRI